MSETGPRLSVEEARPDEEVPHADVPAGAGKPRQGSAGETDATTGKDAPKSSPRDFAVAARSWFRQSFPGHEHAVFGGICGLVVAILVFAIGFWKTLFIVICVLVGVAIGQYADGNTTVVRAISRFFSDNR